MRVITGSARGKRIETLEGRDIRPTGEKTKEAMFSAIQFELPSAHVLDLYAGSGQLGIEALSRGAADCVFVDNSRQSLEIIKKNLANTGFTAVSKTVFSDSVQFAIKNSDKYDIIFADPPYRMGEAARLLDSLPSLLQKGGIALIETEKKAQLPESVGTLVLKKRYCHGIAAVWLYRKED